MAAADSAVSWTPPAYSMGQPPKVLASLSPSLDEAFPENFPRSARWCSDGSAALIQYENRSFGVLDVPAASTASTLSTQSIRVLQQAAPILDYAWYPTASAAYPGSLCFSASVRECPVKLLDAVDGRLRASYKIVDHRERQVAPHSLAFSPMGDKLYCGFEDAIEEFDVATPGEGTRLSTTPSKKTKEGLKGIIASIAFQPSYAPLMAAGSLTPATPSAPNIALLTPEAQGRAFAFCSANGVHAGVSQLAFDPARPHMLYAHFRQHDGVYAWDVRGDTSAPTRVMKTGVAGTNQRLRFGIDSGGRWMGVGDPTGHTSVFDLSGRDVPEMDNVTGAPTGPATTPPILRFKAHDDAVGSVDFHPTRAVMLSVSGSRHWGSTAEWEKPSSDALDSDDSSEAGSERSSPRGPTTCDATIKLWDFE